MTELAAEAGQHAVVRLKRTVAPAGGPSAVEFGRRVILAGGLPERESQTGVFADPHVRGGQPELAVDFQHAARQNGDPIHRRAAGEVVAPAGAVGEDDPSARGGETAHVRAGADVDRAFVADGRASHNGAGADVQAGDGRGIGRRIALIVARGDLLEAAYGHVDCLLTVGQRDRARVVEAAHIGDAVGGDAVEYPAALVGDDARRVTAGPETPVEGVGELPARIQTHRVQHGGVQILRTGKLAAVVVDRHLMRPRPAGEIQDAARTDEDLVDRAALGHRDAAFEDRHVGRDAVRGDQQTGAVFGVLRLEVLEVADRALDRHVVGGAARHHGQHLALVAGVLGRPGVAVDDVVAGLQGRGGADVLHDAAGPDREVALPVEAAVLAVEDGAVFEGAVFFVVDALDHAEVVGVESRPEIGTFARPGIGGIARMVVFQHDGAEAVDGGRAAADVGEVLLAPVPVGPNGETAVGRDRMDLARVDGVVALLDVAAGAAGVDIPPKAAAVAARELDVRGMVAAEPHVVIPQIQIFDEIVVALLVFLIVPAGVDVAPSGHDDAAALDLHVGDVPAARDFHRRAQGADRFGDVAVRPLVRRETADVVRDCHVDRRLGLQIAEAAHVEDLPARHQHFAAHILATVGFIVAEVGINAAGGIVHAAHVLAVAGHGGVVDRGGPRLARAVTPVRRVILLLQTVGEEPEIVVRGGVVVETLPDEIQLDIGGETAVAEDEFRAAVADPHMGRAAAHDREAGKEPAHRDPGDGGVLADVERAAVADRDVAAAGVAPERDVRTLRRGCDEAALVGFAGFQVVVVRLAPHFLREVAAAALEHQSAVGRHLQIAEHAAVAGCILRGDLPV